MVIPPLTVPMVTTVPITAPLCGRAGMDGGIHSGSTDITTIMVLTIPISGAGIHPDPEAPLPAKRSLQKDS